MATDFVDYAVTLESGVRVLVHSKSNFIGDIESAMRASGLSLESVRNIDSI